MANDLVTWTVHFVNGEWYAEKADDEYQDHDRFFVGATISEDDDTEVYGYVNALSKDEAIENACHLLASIYADAHGVDLLTTELPRR